MEAPPRSGPPVLVLGGPTASGKSGLAADLARAVGGAVVSADSRQVYRGLEIGTAQPDAELRLRAPHFLLGFLSPTAAYSAGRFGEDARKVVAALRRTGRPAVLCGGSGLYMRAALGGLRGGEGAAPEDELAAFPGGGLTRSGVGLAGMRERRERRRVLATRWRAEGAERMHAELARVDPGLAERLHPRDRQRVLRGLEFHEERGRALSATWSAPAVAARPAADAPAFPTLRFRLELSGAELARRIEARLDAMLRGGLLEEARALFQRYGEDPPRSLNAVGYPELFAHVRGETDLEETRKTIVARTRAYAKRQGTWFRHQDGYVPVPAGPDALRALLAAWRAVLA